MAEKRPRKKHGPQYRLTRREMMQKLLRRAKRGIPSSTVHDLIESGIIRGEITADNLHDPILRYLVWRSSIKYSPETFGAHLPTIRKFLKRTLTFEEYQNLARRLFSEPQTLEHLEGVNSPRVWTHYGGNPRRVIVPTREHFERWKSQSGLSAEAIQRGEREFRKVSTRVDPPSKEIRKLGADIRRRLKPIK